MSIRDGTLLSIILVSIIASTALAQSEDDLRARIAIDGSVGEYTAVEWVLDSGTSVAEVAGDSRWGTGNDIRRLAVTWDSRFLYLAVDCSIANTSVLVCIDCGCGGLADLREFDPVTRNISFKASTPNLILHAVPSDPRPRMIYLDCSHSRQTVPAGEYPAVFLPSAPPGGALECAIPWSLVPGFDRTQSGVLLPEEGYEIRLLAAVTGGSATGAGDAAPDPTLVLEDDSTSAAVLDNCVIIPLDSDEDGLLDLGTAPREVAAFAHSFRTGRVAFPAVTLEIDRKAFAPDGGERVSFRPVFESRPDAPVPVTARVYSASGALITVLFRERPLMPGPDGTFDWESWDGRDENGSVVPGGIYVISVMVESGSAGNGRNARQAIAVIR